MNSSTHIIGDQMLAQKEIKGCFHERQKERGEGLNLMNFNNL